MINKVYKMVSKEDKNDVKNFEMSLTEDGLWHIIITIKKNKNKFKYICGYVDENNNIYDKIEVHNLEGVQLIKNFENNKIEKINNELIKHKHLLKSNVNIFEKYINKKINWEYVKEFQELPKMFFDKYNVLLKNKI